MAIFGQAREDNRRPSATKTQKKFDGFKLEDVVVGGSFSAQFGTATLVDISPTAGYKIKENLLVGIGARYIYFQQKFTNFTYQTNVYGGGPFAQYFFLENFIAHTEYEYLSLEANTTTGERIGIESFLVGGGYRSPIGGNSYAGILLLYNVLDDDNAVYSNPILRFSFGIGL